MNLEVCAYYLLMRDAIFLNIIIFYLIICLENSVLQLNLLKNCFHSIEIILFLYMN